MTLDLDAIRARDATCANDLSDVYDEARPDDWRTAAADRRALLAEVDRLMLHIRNLATLTGAIRDSERARALPVIEAAREVNEATTLEMLDEAQAALGAALAEYDR